MPITGYHNPSYIHVRDRKAQNTVGGTFTQDAWRTRDLTEILFDDDGLAALAANQVTLQPGTYYCSITAPAYRVEHHQLRLRDITNAATLLTGTTERNAPAAFIQTAAFLTGRFTLTAATVLEVQHYCTATYATHGFGNRGNITIEIYTVAEFWRLHE